MRSFFFQPENAGISGTFCYQFFSGHDCQKNASLSASWFAIVKKHSSTLLVPQQFHSRDVNKNTPKGELKWSRIYSRVRIPTSFCVPKNFGYFFPGPFEKIRPSVFKNPSAFNLFLRKNGAKNTCFTGVPFRLLGVRILLISNLQKKIQHFLPYTNRGCFKKFPQAIITYNPTHLMIQENCHTPPEHTPGNQSP